jgi:tetratricopeptide (TPR) repeat protein
MQLRIVRLVCKMAVLWLALATGGAHAQAPSQAPTKTEEKAAREAFERGRVYYDGGEFDQAAGAFEEAYRLSRRDALLYNLYLAYRDANQQQQAADALRNYLAKVPNIENRGQLEARLHALDQGLAREREEREREQRLAATPVPAPVVIAPAPAAPEPAPVTPTGHSKKFWAGVGLGGAGAAMMLASIATGVMAKGKQSDLEEMCPNRQCEPGLKSTADSGETLAMTTDVLLFGGLAVAAAGAVLVVLDLRSGRDRKLAVDGDCTRFGCTARAAVRF